MWDTRDALEFQKELLRTPPGAQTQEERLAALEAKQEVTEGLYAFTAYYDSGDIDGLVELYSDDAVLFNQRGKHVGRAAIRRDHEFLIDHLKDKMHFITNVVVRLDTAERARRGSYLHAIAVRALDGYTYGTGGTYADHLERRHGRWEITERRVTGYIPYDLKPQPVDFDRFGTAPRFAVSDG